jgi:nucleotide-binding universal stress UspA family protein
MELIILTVGLELGVINTDIYGMMVVMALATTAMTAPLLSLVRRGGVPDAERPAQDDKIFSVLIPVSRPESGGPLIEVASYLAGEPNHRRLVALHLDRLSGADLYRGVGGGLSHPASAESLAPLLEEAEERGIVVEPQSYFSRDIASDISRVARSINSDLVLIGHHTPVFSSALLGGVVHRVMTGADCDVAVLIERNFTTPKRLLVPFLNSTHDRLALELAGKIAKATGAQVTIIHVATRPGSTPVDRVFEDPTQTAAVQVKVVTDDSPTDAVLAESAHHDLTIIGVAEEWGLESSLLGFRAERVASECPSSLLIVRRYQPQD